MQQRSAPQKITRHIYTWNPDLEKFQSLPLQEKILMFNQIVMWCQTHFQDNNKNSESTVCMIVAPDLIFCGVNGKHYTQDDNEDLKVRLATLQVQLDPRVLVIAGTIRFLTKNEDAYKIIAYAVSQNAIHSYGKKEPASDVIHQGKLLPLAKGQQSGIFNFNGLSIGLEICQDHNTGTLAKEVGQRSVDVHVLLCHAQNIRTHHIAADSRRNGALIVCELQPGHVVNESKVYERTACYSLRTSIPSTNNVRQAFFDQLPKSITTKLVAEEQTMLGDISHCVQNSPTTKSMPAPK